VTVVRAPDWLRPALRDEGGREPPGAVFAALEPIGDDWPQIRAELDEAFQLTRRALTEGLPVVYVVWADDLLGRRGGPSAMVATALLSAARTAALEAAKANLTVNTLALDGDPDPGSVARWVLHLMEPGAPTGELVRFGIGHLGKLQP
jgi:hypothetical protein